MWMRHFHAWIRTDSIPALDRQTDRRSDRIALCMLTRDKNGNTTCSVLQSQNPTRKYGSTTCKHSMQLFTLKQRSNVMLEKLGQLVGNVASLLDTCNIRWFCQSYGFNLDVTFVEIVPVILEIFFQDYLGEARMALPHVGNMLHELSSFKRQKPHIMWAVWTMHLIVSNRTLNTVKSFVVAVHK